MPYFLGVDKRLCEEHNALGTHEKHGKILCEENNFQRFDSRLC